MTLFEDTIFPRHDAFDRALLRLVTIADRHGCSLKVADFKVTMRVSRYEVTYELQVFGRTVVRRYHDGRLLASTSSYDFDQGLDFFERYVQEVAR